MLIQREHANADSNYCLTVKVVRDFGALSASGPQIAPTPSRCDVGILDPSPYIHTPSYPTPPPFPCSFTHFHSILKLPTKVQPALFAGIWAFQITQLQPLKPRIRHAEPVLFGIRTVQRRLSPTSFVNAGYTFHIRDSLPSPHLLNAYSHPAPRHHHASK